MKVSRVSTLNVGCVSKPGINPIFYWNIAENMLRNQKLFSLAIFVKMFINSMKIIFYRREEVEKKKTINNKNS